MAMLSLNTLSLGFLSRKMAHNEEKDPIDAQPLHHDEGGGEEVEGASPLPRL
ncbi:hypothetical protein glysoja_029316 [Glycine soja]|uniref:Uncharacterized protein n=1 Tax=Glycine soja TaxID=3848 RepID=A0A0B2R3B8_GLYSO|nr:hypothetical protein glysoja_029316 [Glycine soja]